MNLKTYLLPCDRIYFSGLSDLSYILTRLYEISGLNHFSWWQAGQFLLIVAGVFVLELGVVGWKKSSLRVLLLFEKTTQDDFFIWLTELFGLFNILAFFFSFGVCYYLAGLIQTHIDFQWIQQVQNGTIQFIIVYILSDLKEYIKHYTFHKVPTLWEIHAFHHSAEKFNLLTTYRFHYLQSAIGTFFDVSLFVLLGAPLHTYLAVRIFSAIHGLLVHSNIEHNWGWIGKYVLVSPAAHRIHHSKESRHFNKNLGGALIVWDRLFGTYCPPEKVDALGIPDNPYNKKGFLYDLCIPFIAIRRLWSRRK